MDFSNAAIGIDLGTSYSIVYKYENGVETPISDLTASVVDTTTGEVGNDVRKRYSPDIQRSFKVDILHEWAVVNSARVLIDLKRQAQIPDGTAVCITVPAYFNSEQRKNTIKAATLAKFGNIKIINEPTAAAILFAKEKQGVTLVFDLGGGTFDISVIDSSDGFYDVQATNGIPIGGDNLDRRLAEYILSKCGAQMAYHSNPLHKQRLKNLAEHIKITIQQKGKASVRFCDYGLSQAFSKPGFEMDGELYYELIKSVFYKTIEITRRTIKKSCSSTEGLNFLLVGGSTKDPYLQRYIKESFPGIPILDNPYDVQHIVAAGAACYMDMFKRGIVRSKVSDVISAAIGITMIDGSVKQLIKPDTPLPAKRTTTEINPHDDDGILLEIVQGNESLAKDCHKLGMLEYAYKRGRQAGNSYPITVTLRVTEEGILTLSAAERHCDAESIVLQV